VYIIVFLAPFSHSLVRRSLASRTTQLKICQACTNVTRIKPVRINKPVELFSSEFPPLEKKATPLTSTIRAAGRPSRIMLAGQVRSQCKALVVVDDAASSSTDHPLRICLFPHQLHHNRSPILTTYRVVRTGRTPCVLRIALPSVLVHALRHWRTHAAPGQMMLKMDLANAFN
jgi:hypothetical protein